MTCIVGLVDNGIVHIGCDSMGSNGHTYAMYPRKKIFKIDDRFIFGVCGSYASMDAMEHFFKPPILCENHNTAAYMRQGFIPVLKDCLGAQGVLTTKNGAKYFDSPFLVGFDGNLFLVQDDFSVLETPEMGASTGSGETAAIAVLFDYCKNRKSTKPIDKLKAALEAASACVVSVGGEFHFDNVKKVYFSYG